MRFGNELTHQDAIDGAERLMRTHISKEDFATAKAVYDAVEAEHEEKTSLWFRFNARERRLMKASSVE